MEAEWGVTRDVLFESAGAVGIIHAVHDSLTKARFGVGGIRYPFEARFCCIWRRKQGLEYQRVDRLECVAKAAVIGLLLCTALYSEDGCIRL